MVVRRLAAFGIAASLLGLARSASAAAPEVSYALHCRGCHLADGQGTPGRVPRIAGVLGTLLHAPGGRAYLVRVPGVAQAPLGDRELAELLNWLLVEQSAAQLPPDFTPYTDAEVASYRSQPLLDLERARPRLLEPPPSRASGMPGGLTP